MCHSRTDATHTWPESPRNAFQWLESPPACARRYQIRRAFVPAPGTGNKLIVADYGQLELRILAHLAEDEDMVGGGTLLPTLLPCPCHPPSPCSPSAAPPCLLPVLLVPIPFPSSAPGGVTFSTASVLAHPKPPRVAVRLYHTVPYQGTYVTAAVLLVRYPDIHSCR